MRTVFAVFYFVFEGNFKCKPPGSLYLEGRFSGGVFCVTSLGGLYLEGLIFGNLRYFPPSVPFSSPQPICGTEASAEERGHMHFYWRHTALALLDTVQRFIYQMPTLNVYFPQKRLLWSKTKNSILKISVSCYYWFLQNISGPVRCSSSRLPI